MSIRKDFQNLVVTSNQENANEQSAESIIWTLTTAQTENQSESKNGSHSVVSDSW